MVVGEKEGELGERLIGGSSGLKVLGVVGEEKVRVRFIGGGCLCPKMVTGEKVGDLGENVGELGENVIGDGEGVVVVVEVVGVLPVVRRGVEGAMSQRIGDCLVFDFGVGLDIVDGVSGVIVEGVGGADDDEVM